MELTPLVERAKKNILNRLHEQGTCRKPRLETYVVQDLTKKVRKDGKVVHRRRLIHELAFILAYKQLESLKKINIQRPPNVPHPMTDFETTFSLNTVNRA